jgi:hypothetical protein
MIKRKKPTWCVNHMSRTSEAGTEREHSSENLCTKHKKPLYLCLAAIRYTISDLYASENLEYKNLCFVTSTKSCSFVATGIGISESVSFSNGSDGYLRVQISLHLINAYSSFSSSKIAGFPTSFANLNSQYCR